MAVLYSGAFRYDTAGMFPFLTAALNQVRSYWWLAWSGVADRRAT